MQATELIRVEQEGVEFYTVVESGLSGMSQSGLATLAGVSRTTLQNMEKTLATLAPSEWLKPFVGERFTLATQNAEISGGSVGNLKIYRSDYCAAVLQHYASLQNSTALFSLLKFTEKGIESWIHGITGYQKPSANFQLPQTMAQALRLAADQQEKIELQQKQLEEALPKADVWDKIVDSQKNLLIGEVAKVIGIAGMGRNNLFEFLREQKILISTGSQWNEPYQRYIESGHFKTKEVYQENTGLTHVVPLVTPKGVELILNKLKESGYIKQDLALTR